MANGHLDLSGFWRADDGGTYYLSQQGYLLWWVGVSDDHGMQKGLSFCNVFYGSIRDGTISGQWADVPRGRTMSSGGLILQLMDDGSLLKQRSSGGFGARTWQLIVPLKKGPLPPCDAQQDLVNLSDKFHTVYKNDGSTLLDNLRPFKDHAVLFGSVVVLEGPPVLNYPSNAAGRSYKDFCQNTSLDGDFTFDVLIDFSRVPGDFYSGWRDNQASDFLAKMFYQAFRQGLPTYSDLQIDPDSGQPTFPGETIDPHAMGYLHAETIMYGRTAACGDTQHYDDPPLLPGWGDQDGNSVLVNGRPLNGQVFPNQDPNLLYVQLGDVTLRVGDRVRVTGALALDCGHGYDVVEGYHPCYQGFPDRPNQEMHPVYTIDVLDRYATPSDDLTGVWGGDDGGTYYIHQVGSTVWMLGMTPFGDQCFASVFYGHTYATNPRSISFWWQDVPLGNRQDGGYFDLIIDPGNLTASLALVVGPSPFSKLEKLYDAYDRTPRPTIKIKHDRLSRTCQGKEVVVVPQDGPNPTVIVSVDISQLWDKDSLAYTWTVYGATRTGPLDSPTLSVSGFMPDTTVKVSATVTDIFGIVYQGSYSFFAIDATEFGFNQIWCSLIHNFRHILHIPPQIIYGPDLGPDSVVTKLQKLSSRDLLQLRAAMERFIQDLEKLQKTRGLQ